MKDEQNDYCTKRLDETIQYIQTAPSKMLIAFAHLQFAVDLLKHTDNTDEALRILLDETINTKRLITPNGDYIFIHEVFPNDVSLDVKEFPNYFTITRVHIYKEFIDKTQSQAQEIIDKLSAKTNVNASIARNIMAFWNLQFKNPCRLEDLRSAVDFYKYVWFDVIDLDVIQKGALVMSLQVRDRYFVIGSGFTLEKVEKQIAWFQIVISFFICLAALYGIYYMFHQYIPTQRYVLYYFIIGLIAIITMSISFKPTGSYDREMEEKKILNNIAIGIAASSVSLILSSIFVYFKSPRIRNAYIKTLLIGLTVVIVSILIQPYNKNSSTVGYLKQIQLVILNISSYFILLSVLIFISNM
jgi:hypothetical protein